MMRHIKFILPVLVLLLVFLLIRQNLEVLNQQLQFKLNLWVRTFESASHPLWLILTFTLFIGVLGTGFYSLAAVLKLSKTNRQLRHDLEILKSELQTLKPPAPDAPAPPVSPTA